MNESQYADLFEKRNSLIKPGLQRMQRAWQLLPSSKRPVPTILVAGTNGKGSTSGFLYQLLRQLNLKMALYSSPHLRFFRERFYIADQEAIDEEILQCWHSIKKNLPSNLYAELSFFEIATLIALELFHGKGVQLQILEVGMGGRFDATNIVEPLLSVVTSIGFDHEFYLGDTLDKIAAEKAGIAREGKTLFWGYPPAFDSDVIKDTREALRQSRQPVMWWGQHFQIVGDEILLTMENMPHFSHQMPHSLRNHPPYLQRNFCLALAVFRELLHRHRHQLCLDKDADTDDLLKSNLRCWEQPIPVVPPTLIGRFQDLTLSLKGQPQATWFKLDVCHNIDGVAAMLEGLNRAFTRQGNPAHNVRAIKPRRALVSILADKRVDEMLDLLAGYFEEILLFQIPNQRTFEREQLAQRHKKWPFFSNFNQALDTALKLLQGEYDNSHKGNHGGFVDSSSHPLVVCGSVLAVGMVLDDLNARAVT